MKCSRIQDLFPLFLENKLDSETRRMFDLHLKECGVCSGAMEDFKKTARLAGVRAEKELPEGYFDRLDRKLEEAKFAGQEPSPWALRRFTYLPALAAILIAVGIGFHASRGARELSREQVSKSAVAQKQDKKAATARAKSADKVSVRVIEIVKRLSGNATVTFRGGDSLQKTKIILQQWHQAAGTSQAKPPLVIDTAAGWEKLWKGLNGSPEAPAVDFAKNRAIAVFDENPVSINRVSESKNKIYLEINEPSEANTQKTVPTCTIIVISN